MRLRVYLDTSVFSAYLDDAAPDRRDATREFWDRFPEFEVAASVLTRMELAQTLDEKKRAGLLDLLQGITLLEVTDEASDLARRYVAGGAFSGGMLPDATHVAIAVLARQDVLASWNFRHLVNRRRRARVNELNVAMGLPHIDIVAPPEV